MVNKSKIKAIAAFSGGLDSILAIKIVLEQDIDIIALNFKTSFCRWDKSNNDCTGSSIKRMADHLGVEFKAVYLGDDYLEMVRDPKYGYGKNINPCIDCRIFKFKVVKKFMDEIGASFVITGEVLGQRPMSQHRRSLTLIEKESGLEGLILRPLSAKLFSLTIPEEKGWVNRDNLLDISGRTRKPQIELAKQYGIRDYPTPAGGCLLTDKYFSKRLRDLFKFGNTYSKDLELLKVGRHFRISNQFKLIVGRDEQENQRILDLSEKGDLFFEPLELSGPSALGKGIYDENIKEVSSKIIARYTSLNEKVKVITKIISEDKELIFDVFALEDSKIKEILI
ncbi:MAG: hypothetical protein KAJ79_00875 [Candidatus Omnitrophica bacterium]|nr:hypothetical protein [Candidatus Omnitrophota bacterium]